MSSYCNFKLIHTSGLLFPRREQFFQRKAQKEGKKTEIERKTSLRHPNWGRETALIDCKRLGLLARLIGKSFSCRYDVELTNLLFNVGKLTRKVRKDKKKRESKNFKKIVVDENC